MNVTKITIKVLNKFLALIGLKLTRPSKSKESGVDEQTTRRIFQFEQYMKTRHLEGVIIEAGVGSGGGVGFMLTMQNYFFDERTLWAFDSFEGFPKPSQYESREFRRFGRPGYKKYTLTYVRDYIKSLGVPDSKIEKTKFIKGFVPGSYSFFDDSKIVLLNCDLDLYEPTKETLVYFWPYMVAGGIILLDEYDLGLDIEMWPGAKKAIDEFCVSMNLQIQRGYGNRAFLEKN